MWPVATGAGDLARDQNDAPLLVDASSISIEEQLGIQLVFDRLRRRDVGAEDEYLMCLRRLITRATE